MLFAGVPAGKYKVYVDSQQYMPASAEITIKPGAVTVAAVKLVVGQKIVFRLKETEDDPLPGIPWLGYKITKLGSSQPALRDYQGPYWGDTAFFEGPYPRTAKIAIGPGTYRVEAVLRREWNRGVLMAKDNLWSAKMTVKVLKGKYAIVDIPVEK